METAVNPPNEPDPADSLAHLSWVRRLASELVSDTATADDLAQQTLTVAWIRRPFAGPTLHSWLARTLRHLAQHSVRSRIRRSRREAASARPEALPSTLEMLERAAAHQEVIRAVERLAEPYRTTVLLRFFEDHPPRDIAARQGVPVATVNSRLQRGLDLLRGDLARRRSEGKSWLAVLAPSAGLAADPIPTTVWILAAMKIKIAAVVMICIAAISAILWWSQDSSSATDDVSRAAMGSMPAAARVELAPASQQTAAAREHSLASRHPESRKSESSQKVSDLAAGIAKGRVIDVRGNPVPGLSVYAAAGVFDVSAAQLESIAKTTSDGDGRFAITIPQFNVEIEAENEQYTTLLASTLFARERSADSTVVVASRVAVEGTVVDRNGSPVPDAMIWSLPPDDLRATLGEVLDRASPREPRVTSDRSGRFSLPALAVAPRSQLRVEAPGYLTVTIPTPANTVRDFRIELESAKAEEGLWSGRVFDLGGRPVAGAVVIVGDHDGVCNERGEFAVRAAALGHATLRAYAKGLLPIERRVEPSDPAVRGAAGLEVRLDREALAISGIVVNAKDEPMPNVRVWIDDSTPIRDGRGAYGPLEGMVSGTGWGRVIDTDAGGRFRLEGLLDREYRVGVLDPATLNKTLQSGVRAGTSQARILLPDTDLWPRVAGRVLATDGTPMEGVRVSAGRTTFLLKMPGGGSISNGEISAEVETDGEGRFELKNVARAETYLTLFHKDIISSEPLAPDPAHIEHLELRVPRRCHVRVELSDATEPAEAFSLLDARGAPLLLEEWSGTNVSRNTKGHLVAGKSPVLACPETAATVVLLAKGKEARRASITLKPGETTVLRP